jgi:hypothetical protein
VKTLFVENETPQVADAPKVEVKQEETEFTPFLKSTPIVDEVKPDHFAHAPVVVQETSKSFENDFSESIEDDNSKEYNWDLASSSAKKTEQEDGLSFEVKSNEPAASEPEMKRFILMDDEVEDEQGDLFGSAEERLKRAKERLDRIATYTSKLKKPEGLAELEKEPAFKRRSVELDNVSHSSDSQVSRYGLFSDSDGSVDLRGDNAFLHDNVD